MDPHPLTVVCVPGLRDEASAHWQTWLEYTLSKQGIAVVSVPPLGRSDLRLETKLQAIEAVVKRVEGDVLFVAHSAGCHMVTHWARRSVQVSKVAGALLVAPPDLELQLPEGYPGLLELKLGGWYPLPSVRLPFAAWVGVSDNDPLCKRMRALDMALAWGADVKDLGAVGHVNPQSGHGPWPEGLDWVLKTRALCEEKIQQGLLT